MRNRRKAILAAALSVMLVVGCSSAQWFALVNALLPLATQVAVQFYTYSHKGTITPADAANIQKFSSAAQTIFRDIGADVTAWQSSKDPSKLAHINDLLTNLKGQAGDLLAALQVKDPNTLAFITAIVQDALDLAGLIPIVVHPQANGASHYEYRTQVSLPKAKSLEDVFKSRLANLPQ